MNKLVSKFQINYILVILLFILELKKYQFSPYDILFKDYINNVYISGYQLNIAQLIFLVSLYTLMLWNFVNIFSISLNNFKMIIKSHSTNLIKYYIKVIIFFFKKLLFSFFFYIFTFNLIYAYIFKDVKFRDFFIGDLEIVKLYILFLFVLLINTTFNFNKAIVTSMCYFTIVLYILFLNNVSFIYYFLVIDFDYIINCV